MAKIKKAERPTIDQAQVLEIASTICETIPGNYAGTNSNERKDAIHKAAWLAFQTRELIESAYDDFDGKAFLLRSMDHMASDKMTL